MIFEWENVLKFYMSRYYETKGIRGKVPPSDMTKIFSGTEQYSVFWTRGIYRKITQEICIINSVHSHSSLK